MPSKTAFLTLQREFAGGLADPVQIVVTGDVQSSQAQSAIQVLQSKIADNDVFSDQTVVTPSRDGTAEEVSAYLQGTTSSDTAINAIRVLRDQTVPSVFGQVPGVAVDVGGNTAIFTDSSRVARCRELRARRR